MGCVFEGLIKPAIFGIGTMRDLDHVGEKFGLVIGQLTLPRPHNHDQVITRQSSAVDGGQHRSQIRTWCPPIKTGRNPLTFFNQTEHMFYRTESV